ncbi:NAD(P)/FAD-dependent oxidoreductase [Zhenpiania hominis]|uniref:FAD-dependent oxidoreductase n=1 Tax=Zhenpiania hominis TaxID=2763644 RepID=A0A923NME9_9FIRM|nr:FAD-dependent oxidoreductase [Zhenpiania hominis]MBC6680631.1 FAD-dependent oxidoreductase [Zhenpiania hominis]
MYDVIIIGAGPAGLSAGIYAIRAGLDTLILDKSAWGGQTILSAEIENYPAVATVTGPDFAQKMYDQLVGLGGSVTLEEVKRLDLETKTVVTGSNTYQAKAIIIAAGLKRRTLGCRGEERLTGRGVSYCAICDGRFFTGKNVVIAGGGNTAMEDALYMSGYCHHITILCRGDRLKGEEKLKESIDKKENITVLYGVNIKEILGDQMVEEVLLDNGKYLKTSAVFVAIGYEADSTFLGEPLEMTGEGYVVAGEDCRTNVRGVFIAGDLRTKQVRQIVTAAADGAVAALGAADDILKM